MTALLVSAVASAGVDVKRFYLLKEKATTEAAYLRARERLLHVEDGMTETAFLETMGMRVLQKKGEPFDALMEGYLIRSSQQWNQEREDRGQRFLVFGFVKNGREFPQASVAIVDHRVAEVRWMGNAATVLLATSSERLFYRVKKASTGPSSWADTAERLSLVTVGMPEMVFLDAMHLQVLARRGQPVDAMIGGYLADTSRRLSESASNSERMLAFGWIEAGRDIARAVVVLREGRVSDVRPLTGSDAP